MVAGSLGGRWFWPSTWGMCLSIGPDDLPRALLSQGSCLGRDRPPVSLVCAVVVSTALNRLGDPLDMPESGVPCRSYRGQLGDRASKLRLIHLVSPLAPSRRDVDQADPIEHTEMFRDGLP